MRSNDNTDLSDTEYPGDNFTIEKYDRVIVAGIV